MLDRNSKRIPNGASKSAYSVSAYKDSFNFFPRENWGERKNYTEEGWGEGREWERISCTPPTSPLAPIFALASFFARGVFQSTIRLILD